MTTFSGSEKLIEDLLRLVDDGTITDDERSILTQAIQSNTPYEEGNSDLIGQLQVAMSATQLPGEDQPLDKTLIQGIIEKLSEQRQLETLDEAANRTTDQKGNSLDPDAEGLELVGRSIGNYRVLQLIGRGGMGAVYEATDQMLHRHVALKVMLPGIAARAQNRARFLREARAVARVEHDHICPIYQVGEDQGHAFIAMPLLVGETLESRLRYKRLSHSEIIAFLEQVAQGLDAAHQVGLIHRDIKPANVWIELRKDGTERIRLLDFGLAQMETNEPNLTQPGSIMGTPAYMAPEQARAESVDARTDLFSVGAILYELLTGQRPFDGSTPTAVLSSILVKTPEPPAIIDAACPSCLSELAMRLIEKEPENRLPNAAELRFELDRCRNSIQTAIHPAAKSDPVTAPPTSAKTLADTTQIQRPAAQSQPVVVPTLASARERGPRIWPLVAALGLLAVGLAGVFYLQTPTGTLVVETSDDARVLFEKGELQVLDQSGKVAYRLTAQAPTEKLASGKYSVQVVGVDGLALSTDSFVIRRDEKSVIRVTATPNPTARAENESAEVVATKPMQPVFKGQPVFATNFKDPKQWPLPLLNTSKTISEIKNERLVYRQLLHDPASPFLTVSFLAKLQRGAFAIRCRAEHGQFFFNFGARHAGTKTRAFSLSIRDGEWHLFVQRQDLDGKIWKLSSPIKLTTSKIQHPRMGKEDFVDIAFRWSEKNYDLWMDGESVAGGSLPTDELLEGSIQPSELGMRTSPEQLPSIEIAYIGLWDQSEVSLEEARDYSPLPPMSQVENVNVPKS